MNQKTLETPPHASFTPNLLYADGTHKILLKTWYDERKLSARSELEKNPRIRMSRQHDYIFSDLAKSAYLDGLVLLNFLCQDQVSKYCKCSSIS